VAYVCVLGRYRHIAHLAGNTDIVLPVPAFNIINGGSHAGTSGPGVVNVNVNELRLGFSNTTRNPEGILSHNNRKS
jgi:hypothetical protein